MNKFIDNFDYQGKSRGKSIYINKLTLKYEGKLPGVIIRKLDWYIKNVSR